MQLFDFQFDFQVVLLVNVNDRLRKILAIQKLDDNVFHLDLNLKIKILFSTFSKFLMPIFNTKKPLAQSKVIVNSCYKKVNLKEKNTLDFLILLSSIILNSHKQNQILQIATCFRKTWSIITHRIIHVERNIFAIKAFLVIHQMLLRLQVISWMLLCPTFWVVNEKVENSSAKTSCFPKSFPDFVNFSIKRKKIFGFHVFLWGFSDNACSSKDIIRGKFLRKKTLSFTKFTISLTENL